MWCLKNTLEEPAPHAALSPQAYLYQSPATAWQQGGGLRAAGAWMALHPQEQAEARSLLRVQAADSRLTADLFRTSLGIRHPAAG